MSDTKRLITIQRVNAAGDGYDIYYPKTIASQVFYDEANGLTVQDHITDTAHIHLSATERTALDATNGANGYLKLDSSGYVPSANLNPAVLAITTEFATIAAMLADTTVPKGQIVMVLDASADTTVGSGWAIYRKKMGNDFDYTVIANTYKAATGTYVAGTTYYTDNTGSTVVDTSEFVEGTTDVSAYFVVDKVTGWQKIAEAESLDVVLSWDNIQGKPNSTPSAIDTAVSHDHTHSNKAVIDELADTGTVAAPVLEYKGHALAFSENNTTFTVVDYGDTVPAASSLKAGDFVFVENATLS